MYNNPISSGVVHCFTHSDLDGAAAGAVVRQHYPEALVVTTNYNKPLRLSKIKPGDTVFVTDFSLPIDIFRQLEKRPCKIIWIDHHISAIKQLQEQGWNCEGIRNTEYSGAALTWMYFNPDKTFDQMPDFLKLVNWYDLWQHDKDPRIRPFNYGVGLWDIRPGYAQGEKFWNGLFSNAIGDKLLNCIVEFGKTIQNYVEKYQDNLCKDLAYRTVLNTNSGPKNMMAMAIKPGNSSIFERMDLSGIDALFTGQYISGDVQQYRCSVYTPDGVKEVLDIAMMFGGGGHPTAAGFTLPRYPLNLPEAKMPTPLEEVIHRYQEVDRIKRASPILMKYVNKSSGVSARVCNWHTHFEGYKVIAFNHYYVPDLIPMLPTSTECINLDNGDVAELYLGYVMTNCGQYRCSVHPTSTSTDINQVLNRLKSAHPETEFKLIDGGIWWYSTSLPVDVPINTNLQPQG